MTSLLLHGGLVFDGSGAAPTRGDVVLEDERIVEVALGGPLAARATERLDVTGMLLAPGLIDCHVHTIFDGMDTGRIQSEPFSLQFYRATGTMRRLLDSGVTTVRDAGGADLGMRVAQECGLLEGPRLRIAISALSQTGGHVDGWTVHGDAMRLFVPHPGRPECVVDGVDAMRLRVRELTRAGADVIKVCASGGVMSTRDDPRHPQFSLPELRACVEQAADAGVGVMAHAHSAEGIVRALRAGVRSIEHGIFLDQAGIELLLEKDAWLVPTLLAPVALVEALDAGMVVAPEVAVKARGIAVGHLERVKRAHEAGVRIAMGTDSGVFAHGSTHRELELLVRVGLSAEQALATATSQAAQLLDLTEVGTLTVGALADVIALAGDWTDFARFRENLRLVFQNGQLVRDHRADDQA